MDNHDKIDLLAYEVSSINNEYTHDQLAQIMDQVKFHEERIKVIKKAMEAAIFDHIQATGQRIKIGETEYYIGPEKKTKIRKEKAGELLQLCIDLSGGNTQEAALNFLSSAPFKYGELKKQAGEDAFNQFFDVTYEDKLETTGEKKLKSFNPQFIK